MVVEQERGTVEPDRGLAGSRPALHREHTTQGRADHVVLFGLDRGDDVEHQARATTLDLREQRVASPEPDVAQRSGAVAEDVVGDRKHA